MRYIWLIPLLPGIGAAINGLLGVRYFSRKAAGLVACSTMVAALGVSLLAFWQFLGLPADGRAFDVSPVPGFPRFRCRLNSGTIGGLPVMGVQLDPLSAMLMLIVTGIGTLIHVFSTCYMADEPEADRAFFCYLNLFCFSMLLLVMGDNFLMMFVGWEGVGLCSYLLIGFWYEKKARRRRARRLSPTVSATSASSWACFSSSRPLAVRFRAVHNDASAKPIETGHWASFRPSLLLFIGASGNSPIPLYVWLPDAMEGPTPVSR